MDVIWLLLLICQIVTFLDEWNNFMERVNCKNESEVRENEENILHLRHWVSLRGQTLCRTGRFLINTSRFVFDILSLKNTYCFCS